MFNRKFQLLGGGSLSLIAVSGGSSLRAGQPEDAALARLHAMRADLGLDGRHGFRLLRRHQDGRGQTHVRLQQTFLGVDVYGGEAIAHFDKGGRFLPLTYALMQNIALAVVPSLQSSEALAIATKDLHINAPFAYPPTAELVVFPLERSRVKASRAGVPENRLNAEDLIREVEDYRLAYHVHTQVEDGQIIAHTDYMVDAHSGAVIKKWDSLQTANVVGTGQSEYSGTVNLNTNSTGSGYQLYDTVRGMNFKTLNVAGTRGGPCSTDTTLTINNGGGGGGDPSGLCYLFTNAGTSWGDGANFNGSSYFNANGQAAAVDAHFGSGMAYDYYKNIYGRNGIDGTGRPTYNKVHFGPQWNNAQWDSTCFCMSYGDGDGTTFKTMTALDVAGHEMSHGVCATTANLTYSGESGGLNESNSDINGNMVELYSRSGFTVPTSVSSANTCWTVGEQLRFDGAPLRYMYQPSLDGKSPNAWSSTLGGLDVHFSSGPNNRMFFFLSQGASSSSTSPYFSSYLPSGMTGIGPAEAARIWYQALTAYMTSSTNYAGARLACIQAASGLYGASSPEVSAVQNAYAAINVGAPAQAISVAVSPQTASVNAGGSVQFTATVTGTTNTAVTWQVVETSGGFIDKYLGKYLAPPSSGTFHVQATSQADPSKFDQATVFVTPPSDWTFTEVESNDTLATANTLPTGNGTISGTVSTSADLDYFAVPLGAGRTLTATLTSGDDALALLDASSNVLASTTGAAALVSYTNSTAASQTVYLRVGSYLDCASGLVDTSQGINPNPCFRVHGPYTVGITR